ncbi:hypothetical protein KP509_1Z302500 [Ceratopteris richardii]|nr:hypothetical protein KP509_1Z302500 [Ceratopteris richardii]
MTPTTYGATIGARAGVGVGLYKRQIPFTWFTSTGANCAIATCCFCIGTGINFGALMLKEYRLHHLLAGQVSNEGDKATISASKQSLLSALYNFELPGWSPIQKLDEEEAKRRLVERENQ